jgi:hypothetical protein
MGTTASKAKFSRRLNRHSAKLLEPGRMTDHDLWFHLNRELTNAVDYGERWEARQAFYAACRAQAYAAELHLRGEQLRLQI